MPCLFIGPTVLMERGVFTSEALSANSIIEVAPVLVMSSEERKVLDKTLLHDYIFEWGEQSEQCCMALGYVSIYNHSYNANCHYEMDFDNQQISIHILRDVAAGEELFINYNGESNNRTSVWFDAK